MDDEDGGEDYLDYMPLIANPDCDVSVGAARECAKAFARVVDFGALGEDEGFGVRGKDYVVTFFRQGGIIKAHIANATDRAGL